MRWDENRLSYRSTGQYCERFTADHALMAGRTLPMGKAVWEIHPAPGHDPDAVMLFEPQTRTLLSGDALWEDRLAIIFPELDDQPGFPATRHTLDWIEQLSPRLVIPGHGAAFEDAGTALAASRQRLDAFEREPIRHLRHAARSLVMFHLLEHQLRVRSALEAWLQVTPLFMQLARKLSPDAGPAAWARLLIDKLIDDGLLHATQDEVWLPRAGP
jgi:glyoxylase-like metal-dependent hydrolase (beta-lactamase superfamily II)